MESAHGSLQGPEETPVVPISPNPWVNPSLRKLKGLCEEIFGYEPSAAAHQEPEQEGLYWVERVCEELKASTRARERVLNHLAHELGTPLSILSGVLAGVSRQIEAGNILRLKKTIERGNRSVKRLLDLKSEIEDIMIDRPKSEEPRILHLIEDALGLVEEACEAETEKRGRALLNRLAQRLRSVHPTEERRREEIALAPFLHAACQEAAGAMGERRLELAEEYDAGVSAHMPVGVLKKVCGGLIKNAIENTPDEGRVLVRARSEREGTRIEVRDYGIGIHLMDQRLIFSGFFHIQDNADYATRKPYEFNAGGAGADLLRMKVFSERYRFSIRFVSTRCKFIPEEGGVCPGRISECAFVRDRLGCLTSGGSLFWITIPDP